MQSNLKNVEVIESEAPVIAEQETQQIAIFDASKINLNQLGLNEKDLPAVEALVKEFKSVDNLSVAEYGKDISSKTNSCTTELLELVKNKDLDETGAKLNQVITVAQGINSNNLVGSSGLAKLPIIGGLFKSVTRARQNFAMKFNSTNEQINSLVGEIETNQNGLKERINLLDNMFENVTDEYHSLGIHIAAGQIKLNELKDQINITTELAKTDQSAVQKAYDLNHIYNNLEKRLHDLYTLQQSAQQTLPMIRIIQANNLMLIDKFYAIKNITIPAWKNQISLAISLEEQKNSVELATTIDNATNELLRRNADLLHTNSVQTAKANQRSVIDVETLEHVQSKLIQTVNDVIAIQKQGVANRDNATKKLQQLQDTYKKTVSADNMRLISKK